MKRPRVCYLEAVISEVEKSIENKTNSHSETDEMITKAKEILSDPMFINQKGIRSLVDEDA